MNQMSVSQFKAKCLAVLAQVAETGAPVLVTRYGKPVARVVPPPKPAGSDWIGSMKDTGRILGDIVEPVGDLDDWEALH
ncbi:MAG: type II toxin-antitoxin system Phd/YefM family antitoxin [Gammaproteobacteria bacterium]|nr:type II toxin-antitoxin system Phd/YefM family antitoxin [Gammaproteobacteria bacterium]MYH69497.1 type II toxin-antitoxin system Phd/YefM family antitoxin [Gammaproteobacteria bacterium]